MVTYNNIFPSVDDVHKNYLNLAISCGDCDKAPEANIVLIVKNGRNIDLESDLSAPLWGEVKECTEVTFAELCQSIRALRDTLFENHQYLWTQFGSDIEVFLNDFIKIFYGDVSVKDPAIKNGDGFWQPITIDTSIKNNCVDNNVGTCCRYASVQTERIFGVWRNSYVLLDCVTDVTQSDCINYDGNATVGNQLIMHTKFRSNTDFDELIQRTLLDEDADPCKTICWQNQVYVVSCSPNCNPNISVYNSYKEFLDDLTNYGFTAYGIFDNDIDAKNALKSLQKSGCVECTTPTPTEPPVTP